MKHGISDAEVRIGWVNPATGEHGTFNKDGTTRKFKWWEKIRNYYQGKKEECSAWKYFGYVKNDHGTQASIYVNHSLQQCYACLDKKKYRLDYNAMILQKAVIRL